MAKKSWIGQNWVNGLYYVKFHFQHDMSTFRAHWGHRIEIFSILVGILTKFPQHHPDRPPPAFYCRDCFLTMQRLNERLDDNLFRVSERCTG